ncbi:MAG TPA: PEP-CTERM sorting domain-containing protein [Luteolibacter sp.]|nr:PEP-CTERM sorting domain-containing protein [Luteolibacter sp.]
MKAPFRTCLATSMLALGATSQGQTIEWGSYAGIDMFDSAGNVLDDTFVFQLGAFTAPFTPEASNYQDWFANWMVFDQAVYNEADGVFMPSPLAPQMQPDGTSNSAFLSDGATSFEGLDAYIWIYNSEDPVPGTEWLLVRAADWVFPEYDPDCCGGFPLQWSISDLDPSDTPEWGSHSGSTGPGAYTYNGPFDLRTHTFVPEPSSLLLAIFGTGLLMRRRRTA